MAPRRNRLAKENKELDEKSPLWIEVRVLGDDGQPAKELPLKNGTIELTLPRGLFEGRPDALLVEWIDFYR